MVESVIIIISCYICSAFLVHVAYRSLPNQRDASHHYVLVTKNNERQAEFVLRAITWHAWLFGKVLEISVIDENSEDQTIPIIRRLDRDGQVRLLRTRNWAETERLVRCLKRTSNGVDGRSDDLINRSNGVDSRSDDLINSLNDVNSTSCYMKSSAEQAISTSVVRGNVGQGESDEAGKADKGAQGQQMALALDEIWQSDKQPETVTVIYINRLEDRMTIPLFQ